MNKWTKPFYGIIHYLGCQFPIQKTIVDYGFGILAFRLDLNSLHPFTATKEKWFKPDGLEKAKKWIIRQ